MKNGALTILVEKELVEAARNRLIYGFGIAFFVLALALSIVGVISPGAKDVQMSRIGVSLIESDNATCSPHKSGCWLSRICRGV